jgi:hypothetical protein
VALSRTGCQGAPAVYIFAPAPVWVGHCRKWRAEKLSHYPAQQPVYRRCFRQSHAIAHHRWAKISLAIGRSNAFNGRGLALSPRNVGKSALAGNGSSFTLRRTAPRVLMLHKRTGQTN